MKEVDARIKSRIDLRFYKIWYYFYKYYFTIGKWDVTAGSKNSN